MAKTAVAQRAKAPTMPAPTKKPTGTAVATGYSDEAYAGAGSENIGARDILVPRLAILQSLSPQVNKKKSEHIDGAEAGDIADLGAGELFKEGVVFLPVHYVKLWLEWKPRSVGGLERIHDDESIMEQTTKGGPKGKDNVLPSGNYIVETMQFFGLNLSANARPCFISMASTQLKKGRGWNTKLRDMRSPKGGKVPLWYKTWRLSSGEEGNNEGDWFGWVIKDGQLRYQWADDNKVDSNELGQMASIFYESVVSNKTRADTSQLADGATSGASSDDRM